MAFIKVPYVIISPGDATALDGGIVCVSGPRTYPHKGKLLYLTVRVSNNDPNVWRWLFREARLRRQRGEARGRDRLREQGNSATLQDDLIPTVEGRRQEGRAERLGYDVPETGTSIAILDVQCDGPSDGLLHPGDRITAVDGTPVRTADDVGPLIQAKAPGETAHMTVERNGKPRRRGQPRGAQRQGLPRDRVPDAVRMAVPRRRADRHEARQRPVGRVGVRVVDHRRADPGGPHRRTQGRGHGRDRGRRLSAARRRRRAKAVAAQRERRVPSCSSPGEAGDARGHADGLKIVVVRTINDTLRRARARRWQAGRGAHPDDRGVHASRPIAPRLRSAKVTTTTSLSRTPPRPTRIPIRVRPPSRGGRSSPRRARYGAACSTTPSTGAVLSSRSSNGCVRRSTRPSPR